MLLLLLFLLFFVVVILFLDAVVVVVAAAAILDASFMTLPFLLTPSRSGRRRASPATATSAAPATPASPFPPSATLTPSAPRGRPALRAPAQGSAAAGSSSSATATPASQSPSTRGTSSSWARAWRCSRFRSMPPGPSLGPPSRSSRRRPPRASPQTVWPGRPIGRTRLEE